MKIKGRNRRPRGLWLAMVVLLTLIAVVLYPFWEGALVGLLQSEPFSRGKPLSSWVAQLQDADPDKRRDAIDAIGEMGAAGSAAVPALEQVARSDASLLVRSWAIREGLGRIGGPAVGALRALLKQHATRTATLWTIGNMGAVARETVPDVIPFLKDSSSLTRSTAATALARMGPDANRAIPALVDVIKNDPDGPVKRDALAALERIDPSVVERADVKAALSAARKRASPEGKSKSQGKVKAADDGSAGKGG